MYTTAQVSQANTGNGSYGNGSDALDALACIAGLSATTTSTIAATDFSNLVSSFSTTDDGTFNMLQDVEAKQEPTVAAPMHRASCPNVGDVASAAQPRSSCPLIKVTPADPLPAVTMAELTLLNGNALAPPSMFNNPTFAMESLINNMPSSASEWSDVTSEASLSSFDGRGSPHSDFCDFSDDLSPLSDDDPSRRSSEQYLSVPLRGEAPQPSVATSVVSSKYDWPVEILESSRQEFTRMIQNKNLTQDQLEDLRKARRRLKNRRYQKGARNRRRERRERGLEPARATPAKLRHQVESLQSNVTQLQALCQDMMMLLQASNPEGLQQLREKHVQLFPK
eukprot:m.170189 g.170189  ORF g.170189 m.170189 type:complete len:338 (+) comp16683_c0_seq1:141-1154(+)